MLTDTANSRGLRVDAFRIHCGCTLFQDANLAITKDKNWASWVDYQIPVKLVSLFVMHLS
jgi:hypothetical protein